MLQQLIGKLINIMDEVTKLSLQTIIIYHIENKECLVTLLLFLFQKQSKNEVLLKISEVQSICFIRNN